MSKTLRVIDPFFEMEIGDTFTLTEDGKLYSSEHNEEFRKAGDNDEVNAIYNSVFNISVEYAKELIKEGYLEEVVENKKQNTFVNVFDEIDNLIKKYQLELDNIDTTMKDAPQCMKVEKTTVLTNILSVLNHLKTLRK